MPDELSQPSHYQPRVGADPVIRERMQRIKRLPETLREALFSEETVKHLEEITARRGLEKEFTLISKAVGEVLSGSLSPNLLIASLTQKLGIDRERVREIALEISQNIFAPVRQELIEFYHLQPAQSQSSRPEPQPSPLPPQRPPQQETPFPQPEPPSTSPPSPAEPPQPSLTRPQPPSPQERLVAEETEPDR